MPQPTTETSPQASTWVQAARILLAVVVAGLTAVAPLPGQAPPPHATWHTFETPHFQVVFHTGLEEVAARAAERAERGLQRLQGFGTLPGERIQLLVTDHVDLSNGFARPAPYPRITVWARPPVEGMGAMPFDDWLELVVTHELVHILHLEITSPLGRVARRFTGRVPSAWPHFPAFLLPTWGVEGVAVQAESDFTGAGRLHGDRFRAMVRGALLDGRGERLDQVTGSSPRFPGGERPYAWGGAFFHDLAHEHGVEAVAHFVELQARRLNPLALESAARAAFGAPLPELHQAWLDKNEARVLDQVAAIRARGLAPEPRQLTRGARGAFFPHFVDLGQGWEVAWARSDGEGDPALVVGTTTPRVLASLHLPAPLATAPGGSLVTAQPEFRGRHEVRGTLWRIGADGRRAPFAEGAARAGLRVAGADVHPGHGHVVAVLEGEGTKELVLLDPEGRLLRSLAPPDPGIHWSHPRWSPDGSRVALNRWRAGGWWAVGVMEVAPMDSHPMEGLDAEGGYPDFRVVEELPVPAGGAGWSPDGEGLVWSAERGGVANLFQSRLLPGGAGTVRQLTDLVTAGQFPAVSPEGDALVFSLLTGGGWELAQIPWSPEAGFDPVAPVPAGPAQAAMEEGYRARWEGADPRPWSPLPTLRPRHLLPVAAGSATSGGARVLGPRVGIESWAADVVDRHRWDLRLLLPAGGPGRNWEGAAGWRWAGLGNPVFQGGVEQRWEVAGRVAAPDPADPEPLNVLRRERSAALSAGVLRPRWRSVLQGVAELRLLREDLLLVEEGGGISDRARLLRPERDLLQGTLTLTASNARSAPYHPGPARGGSATLRLRERVEVGVPDSLQGVPGGDASRQELLAVVRAYRPVGSQGLQAADGTPPVLALRGALGVARGPGAGGGTWRLGGGGGAGTGPLGFTWDRAPGVFQVRGFEEGQAGGARAWGAGAELRVPLVVAHRGLVAPGAGLLPAHLDRVVGTVWVEGAGTLAGGPRLGPEALVSAGAEAGFLHTLFFGSASLLRVGVAVPARGGAPGGGAASPTLYAAMGWGF